jgi:transcriptional regulator with XRE-family HTH domain
MKSLRSKWHRAVVTVISATRRESNMSQEDLAMALGWHRSRIAKTECGERRLDVVEFISIAQALNLDPEQLLGRVLRWGCGALPTQRVSGDELRTGGRERPDHVVESPSGTNECKM